MLSLASSFAASPYERLWPVVRCVVVGLVAMTAAAIPNMEHMVALTGSVSFSVIGFILPGAFYLKLNNHSMVSLHDKVVSYLLIGLGFVGGIWGVHSTIFAHDEL